MDAGSIIFAAMFWVFAVLFAVISLWIRRRVKPIHFYTFKDPPKPEELSSVADYNRENAKMWAVCAVLWGASGIVSLFSLAVGGALMGLLSTVGVVVLVIAYNRIYRKYKVGD